MQKLWFTRKTFGWGWTPCTWQGWSVIGLYLIGVYSSAYMFSTPTKTLLGALVFLLQVAVFTTLMIIICYVKGETPRWSWGREQDGNKKSTTRADSTCV